MEQVATVIKLKLEPDKETAEILDGQSRICNWLYNHLLEKANDLRDDYKKNPSEEISKMLYTKRGLRNLLPEIKEEHPFLKVVHSSPLKNSALRLSDCIQTYQKSRKGKRKGQATGWPKFRSWKSHWFSLFYDEAEKGYCIEDRNLKLSLGLGEDRKQRSLTIPMQEASHLQGKIIRNLRIVKQAGVFSAVFTVLRELTDKKPMESIGSSLFFPGSFQEPAKFVAKLLEPQDNISQYFQKQLPQKIKALLPSYSKNTAKNKKVLEGICNTLNTLIEKDDFHQRPELFEQIKLRRATWKLICKESKGLELCKLKRLLLEDAYEEIAKNQTIIAFDPNHKNFAYGVDSEGKSIEIEAPDWLKIYDKRIDELKSKRDKCKKNSKQVDVLDNQGKPIGTKRWQSSRRWVKYNRTLERVLAKRRDQTKTFLFTLANMLFSLYRIVIIGDYTPHGGGISTGMRRAMNNRSLIGRFKEILSWVALKSGKNYDIFKEKGTTRTCCECGYVVKDGIHPDVRLWACPACHFEHIRDENAARNGLTNYLRELEQNSNDSLLVPCSGLVSIRERWAWRVYPRGVVSTNRGINCSSTASVK